MNYVRKSIDRGSANFGWLNSKHSFSFGNYSDPAHMGISALRVINDDVIAPSAGFDTHGHQDMEIITYVIEGALKHKDTLGNAFVVKAGEIQRMTAGTGIMHSEYNNSDEQPVKLLQIWIQPDRTGLACGYEQSQVEQTGALTELVTPDGHESSLKIHQAASIFRLQLQAGDRYELATHRTGYLHLVSGVANIENHTFTAGDAISPESGELMVLANQNLEALWFDLP